MRKRTAKKAISLLLTAAMLLSMVPAVFAAESYADSFTNPFTSGTLESTSWRIPAMVTLDNGIIVAAADARWNTTYDGGGLDTAVAYSTDNGATWTKSLENYLGDNGDVYDGGSTCFIDPALATDGSTVWLLCDLYPFGVALNGSKETTPYSGSSGFNSDGYLLLAKSSSRTTDTSSYTYYLKDGKIYSSSGTAVSGLTVDADFNVTGTYNGSTVNSNLFFKDSPFKVYPTGYLYLKSSDDDGKTWSAPTLLNLKTTSENICLVGPGRGLVTSTGRIVFPVYSYTSSAEYLSFVYSDDNGASWHRSSPFTSLDSSEAAVVELTDGTLRFFFRNHTGYLCYADAAKGATTFSGYKQTTIPANSNTQLSAITYSKTIGGDQVILLSCPTGPNGRGSTNSDGSYRTSGKIHVLTVDADNENALTLKNTVNVTAVATGQLSGSNYTESNGFFAYSCLTEMGDGSVALLYENNQYGWGAASDGSNYYTINGKAFTESELETTTVTFDEETVVDAFFTQDGTNPVTALTIDVADGNAKVILANVGTGTQTVTATSSNTGVATVSASDNVLTITPVAAGSTTIAATVGTTTYDLAVTVTAAAGENEELTGEHTLMDSDSGVTVTVEDSILTSVSATKKAAANTPHTGYTACVTYDVVINGGAYTGAAQIKIPYNSVFDGCDTFIGDVGGETFAVSLVDGYFVGTAPHFSDVDINGVADVYDESVDLGKGEVSRLFVIPDEATGYESWDITDTSTQDLIDDGTGTVIGSYTQTTYTNTTEGNKSYVRGDEANAISAGSFVIASGNNTLITNDTDVASGSLMAKDAVVADTAKWTIAVSGDGYTISQIIDGTTYYLGYNESSSGSFFSGYTYTYSLTLTVNATTWSYDDGSFYCYLKTSERGFWGGTTSANHYLTFTEAWSLSTTSATVDLYPVTEQTTGGTTTTVKTVQFTGKNEGTAYETIEGMTYKVIVHGDNTITINYQLDGVTVKQETRNVAYDATSTTLTSPVVVNGVELTLQNTTLTLTEGDTEYDVPVSGGKAIIVNYVDTSNNTVKSEIRVVAEDAETITLDSELTVGGNNYDVINPTFALVDGVTVYSVTVYVSIGISIYYRTANGYLVRTVLKSVAENETSLTLEPTIEGTDGNTYAVKEPEPDDFILSLDLPGQTAYTVLVDYIVVTVTLTEGSSYQIAHAEGYDDSNLTEVVADSYDFTNGTLTVTGVSAGDGGYIIVNSTKYVFAVVSELDVTVETGKTLEIDLSDPAGFNLPLQDGQYVKWESSDSTYAGVAGVYDTTAGVYRNEAVIAGQKVTVDPVVVTAVVYNADGTVAGEYRWNVTVAETSGSESEDEKVKYVYVAIDALEHCDLYYSENGGPLIQITEDKIDPTTGAVTGLNKQVTGQYFLALFAAPHEKGALTAMGATNSAGQFSYLTDGNPDGTNSAAWPFYEGYDWTEYDSEYSTLLNTAGSTTKLANNTNLSKTVFKPTGECGFVWALAEGNITAAQYRIMLDNAIDLGCEGAICFTKNGTGTSTDDSTNSGNIHTTLTVVGQELPSVTKQISGVKYEIDNGNGTITTGHRNAVNGEWGIKLYDTIVYNLNVHIPAQIESGDEDIDYGHFTFTNMTLSDAIMGKDFTVLGGVITCTDGGGLLTEGINYSSGDPLFSSLAQPSAGNPIDLTFEASIQLTPANFNALFGGANASEASSLANTVSLNYAYTSKYAKNSASKTSTVEIEAYVWYDTYVVDFGLPTVIDLSTAPYLHGSTDYKLTSIATYLEHYKGQAIIEEDLENEKFTYTLLAPLTAYDIASYTVENKYDSSDVITYYIYIVPASNMLYEEGFLTAPEGVNAFYADWKGVNVSRVNKTGSMQGFDKEGIALPGTNVTPYGYDAAYAKQTGYSGGYYTTTVNAGQFLSSALTTTVTGTTGFDVIGDSGPDSANLYVLVRANTAGATTRIIVVDTTFEDAAYGTLHQVPLVHVSGLDPEVSYQINISAGYMDPNSVAVQSGSGGSPIGRIYSNLYAMGMTDEEIANAEFVGFEGHNGAAYLSGEDVMLLAEGDQTLVIDGFRLYRSTENSAYYSATNSDGFMYQWEYNAVYTNVSDGGITGEIYAYVEPNTVIENGTATDYETGSYTIGDYDAVGGPQGEIYLPAGSGVVFKLSSPTVDDPVKDDPAVQIKITTAQVSARAVTGSTKMVTGTDESAFSPDIEIDTNTEMYYNAEVYVVDGEAFVSVVNTGTNMLAIANVKALAPLAEISGEANAAQAVQAVSQMMLAYKAGANDSGSGNDETVQVSQQQWTNGSGQTVTTVPQGSVTAHYTVENPLDTQTTVTLMIGAYDVYGKLLDIQTVTFTLAAGESRVLPISMLLPEGTAQVKSFILDGSMNPLFDSPTLYH